MIPLPFRRKGINILVYASRIDLEKINSEIENIILRDSNLVKLYVDSLENLTNLPVSFSSKYHPRDYLQRLEVEIERWKSIQEKIHNL